ncbi:MAG: HTTM domain-containing protein [Bacteroidota bacterium]
MNKLVEKFDRWLENAHSVPLEGLALYRIFYAGYFLLIGGIPNFTWIEQNPDYFYRPLPLSMGTFFGAFPPFWFLATLSAGIGLLFVFLLFGYRTRLVSILLTVALLVGHSFTYAFGKADHNILLLLIPGVMAFSNWGNAYSLDALSPNRTRFPVKCWPLTLLAWMLCFAFVTSGIPKLLGGWLDLSSHAIRYHLVENYYIVQRQDFLAPMFINLTNDFLWESMDWATIFFEVGFVIAFLHRRLLNFFMLVAVVFHFMNLLILNIAFLDNFTTYMAFMSWVPIIAYVRRKGIEDFFKRFFTGRNLVIVSVAVLAFLSIIHFSSEDITLTWPSPFHSVSEMFGFRPVMVEAFVTHTAALVIAIMHLVPFVKRVLGKKTA